jgi:dTDP-4-dehydrorhamnose 3,5-epimerase
LNITKTDLPEVLLLEPIAFPDERGWFIETYHAEKFRQLGLPHEFVQDNHSYSRRGVIRGLHYQVEHPQGKLVRCTRGTILDVAVDIRRNSPTFGKWTAVELSAENRLMLWVPPRFAHGFSVLSDDADVLYKCTTVRHADSERGIRWNDPDLAIDWKVEHAVVSEKDTTAPLLRNADVFSS